MHLKIHNNENNVTISSTKENMIITFTEKKEDKELELTEIDILMLGKKWTGTINDFSAIPTQALNALKLIGNFGIGDGSETKGLQQLLLKFGINAAIPSPDATLERGREMAMISCIITHNFLEDMLTATNSGGMINCYNLIAEWAEEFYNKYKSHNWEDVPSEFANATGWEDVVVFFAKEKLLTHSQPTNFIDLRK